MKILFLMLAMTNAVGAFGLTEEEAKKWTEDINTFSTEISAHHIDPFHSISKKEFEAEIKKTKRDLASKTTNEVLVELMRLTHSIGDGHTSLPLWGWKLNHFPIGLKILDGEIFCIQTTNDKAHLLGAKLKSIDGVASREIIRKIATLTPFSDNVYSTKVKVAEYLPKAEILNGLGIIQDVKRAKFEFEREGKSEVYLLESGSSAKLDPPLSYSGETAFNPYKKISDDLWFGPSADNKTVYVKFRRYTSMSKMEGLAADLLSFIRENASKNVIIDLRDNIGSDFFVGLKLAQQLLLADSINWKSGVYVLIDNVTFSAAMSNAAQFSQILNAKLVGEPTGGKPSGYQDIGQFFLPNSKLVVTYSKRFYHFKDDQKDALYPDINIELSIDDYVKKNDRQLGWILDDIAEK
jgi:hypothetical protein